MSTRRVPAAERPALDPLLRAELGAAVLARPAEPGVPDALWYLVAGTLSSAALALASSGDGADAPSAALLVALAENAAHDALTALQPSVQGWSARPAGAARDPSGPAAVERTCWRLAGLLLGPVPTDVQLLAHCLRGHRAALLGWLDGLSAATRSVRQGAAIPRGDRRATADSGWVSTCSRPAAPVRAARPAAVAAVCVGRLQPAARPSGTRQQQ